MTNLEQKLKRMRKLTPFEMVELFPALISALEMAVEGLKQLKKHIEIVGGKSMAQNSPMFVLVDTTLTKIEKLME